MHYWKLIVAISGASSRNACAPRIHTLVPGRAGEGRLQHASDDTGTLAAQAETTINRLLSILLCVAAVCLSSLSFAGTGHSHGPKYGGVAREVGALTFELVAKTDSMTLYVSDHGKPVATRGAKAEAIVYAGNQKSAITLEAAGENTLTAKGRFKTGVGVRVAMTVVLAGQKETRLTFNLK